MAADSAEELIDLDITDRTLTTEETDDLESAESSIAPVSYSGQDFDVDGLVRRLNNGDIVIPSFGSEDKELEVAGFQRGFVWNRKQMDRFIESLLLGFPIPGLFLVRQQSDKRYLVLDGQQRLTTLQAFYRGVHGGKEFALLNVADEYQDLTYSTLPPALRRTIDNAFLQATVVSTDGTDASLEAVYQIFERLNSGGTQLTPHEIRVALYAGPFIGELERINKLSSRREPYGRKNPRLRDQELILRILALYVESDDYSRPLKGFLNNFTGKYRHKSDSLKNASELFERSAEHLVAGPGPRALRKSSSQVNAAQSEAIFVGLMRQLKIKDLDAAAVSTAVDSLVANTDFDAATTRSTADETVVQGRLRIATEAFASVA